MSAKLSLKTEIESGFSDDLLAAITAEFGTVQEVAVPTTVDDAIIVTGQVNAAFNNAILVPLSGLPIVELILKNGQLNEIYKGLLYSSLEVSDLEVSDDYAGFEILEPGAGLSYAPGANTISVKIIDTEKFSHVSCAVTPPDGVGFTISEFVGIEADVQIADIDYQQVGTYSLKFTVTFGESYTLSKSVSCFMIIE